MCVVVVFFVVVVVAFFSVCVNSAHFEAHSCASLSSGALGGSKPSHCSTVAMHLIDGVECDEKESDDEEGGATVDWAASRHSDAKRATEGAFHWIADDTGDNVDNGVDTDGVGVGVGVSGCGSTAADVEVGVSSVTVIVGSTVSHTTGGGGSGGGGSVSIRTTVASSGVSFMRGREWSQSKE